MQNNLFFFQSTELGGDNQSGLIDLLVAHVNDVAKSNLFAKTQVIVPNQAMAIWVKDQIALRNGICANVDCVVLAGTVIDNIYLDNHKSSVLCDFNQVKFIIYEYLLNNDLRTIDELANYLYVDDSQVDKLRAFQLANQLQNIFHEYLYLRTEELININNSKFKDWQKQIWLHVAKQLADKKTFLDIYRYFAQIDFDTQDAIVPGNLFIFGLTSVYPSQLQILTKLANKTNVYWYYQSCSNEYYGDLLNDRARSKIEQKLLRKPDLSLDDLYLTNGNPLLANLGQQSREFIELLRANDVQVYEFNPIELSEVNSDSTLLEVLQHDIRTLKQRIRSEYRLEQNTDYYADPLKMSSFGGDLFYDLPDEQQSIKINVCHNRMREVQVMFNEIVSTLEKTPDLKCGQILVTAPDIDDYAPYLQAVLDNEYALSNDNNKFKLPYFITGNRRHNSFKILETMQLILLTPYQLTISYLFELLQQSEIQTNLAIDNDDIILVKQWIIDNHTHFGYSEADYEQYGYHNYSVHSFKQLLMNIILGSCLDERLFTDNAKLPQLTTSDNVFVPYDNLDNAQISLANKLISFIEMLEELRGIFYRDQDNYNTLIISDVCSHLDKLKQHLVTDDDALLVCDKFIGELRSSNQDLLIDLPILNALFKDYMGLIKNRLTLSGKITCASLQYTRNLPYQYVYVLGMNFGEFPKSYQANQLSILAHEWYLADRNYNIEDKQAFLDIILATQRQLVISYIGRKETDNTEIKPSPVVSLLISTLGYSFMNFWDEKSDLVDQRYDFKNLIVQHSLHPFYNNKQNNYAKIWQQVSQMSANEAKSMRWDFTQLSPIKLTPEQINKYLQLDFKQLIATFSYINHNLYRVLGLSNYNADLVLEDYEPLELANRNLAKGVYKYLDKYADKFNSEELEDYLHNAGVIGYHHVGKIQFNHYLSVYQQYIKLRGTKQVELKFSCPLTNSTGEIFTVEFNDKVWVHDGAIVICDEFVSIKSSDLAKKLDSVPYGLKIRGLITYIMVAANSQLMMEHGISKVVIRQMNTNGEYHDFQLIVDDPESLYTRVLRYYIRSLTNPVMIHRGAIAEYAKAMNDCYKNGQLKNTPMQCLEKSASKFAADWENYELDNIKADPIFGSIADDYFSYIQKVGGVNDIAQIGNMLAQLRG